VKTGDLLRFQEITFLIRGSSAVNDIPVLFRRDGSPILLMTDIPTFSKSAQLGVARKSENHEETHFISSFIRGPSRDSRAKSDSASGYWFKNVCAPSFEAMARRISTRSVEERVPLAELWPPVSSNDQQPSIHQIRLRTFIPDNGMKNFNAINRGTCATGGALAASVFE
jgi:hypothetical protein